MARKRQSNVLSSIVGNIPSARRDEFFARLEELVDEFSQDDYGVVVDDEPTYVGAGDLLEFVSAHTRQVDRPKRMASVLWDIVVDPRFWYPLDLNEPQELLFVKCDVCARAYGECRCGDFGYERNGSWIYLMPSVATHWRINAETLKMNREMLAIRRHPHYGPKARHMLLSWVDSL